MEKEERNAKEVKEIEGFKRKWRGEPCAGICDPSCDAGMAPRVQVSERVLSSIIARTGRLPTRRRAQT
ncbi:MAG: hypothetical protein NTNFB02_23860 [Nitrospira sp.]